MSSTGTQLRVNGYTYCRKNTYNGKTYWRCALFRSDRCRATVITRQGRNGVEVLKEGEHEHPPESSLDEEISDAESDVNTQSEHGEASYTEDDDVTDDQTEAGGSSDDGLSAQDDEDTDNTSTESEADGEIIEWEVWHEQSDEEDSGSDQEDEDMAGDSEGIKVTGWTPQLKFYKDALRNLCGGSVAVREVVLKEADKGLIGFLCEICWNLHRGYFSYLNKYEWNLIRLIKENAHDLTNKDVGWEIKKEALVERANSYFLPILLNVLLPRM